ncbi:hypothetical protein DRI50_04150 [candidate division KSB1 bacterium]|nr:MAG: hypothetical protein DRI50_04150 [candidate division KSB1 bacterium]
MQKIKLTIIAILVSIVSGFSGESVFGINDYTLGVLELPYSYAGLGRGFEIGNSDSLRINFTNFAVWPVVPHPTYGLRLGYTGAFAKSTSDRTMHNDYANFEGGFLGIPVLKKKLVFGVGIQPVTNVEQSMKKKEGSLDKYVLIKGGTSQAYFNVSYAITPHIRLGAAYAYHFGEITRSFRMELQDAQNPFTFEYQYRYYGNVAILSSYFNPIKNLGFGIVVKPGYTLRVRIKPQTHSTEVNKSKLKKLTIPAFYGTGVQYNLNTRSSVGFDFLYQDWGKGFKVENVAHGELFSSFYRVSAGFERRQSHKMFTSFSEKLDYRAGIFYGKQNYLSLGNAVKEYGISFGLSLPITRFRSRIDFTGLVGQRGSLGTNEYRETFFKFGITINASELWFVKLED